MRLQRNCWDFPDPIGQRIGNDVIVGVVKDFHFRSLHYPIEPLLMSNNPEEIEYNECTDCTRENFGNLKLYP